MLSATGCSQRRQRFWQQLDPPPDSDHLILSDPIHLAYLANFWVDPIKNVCGVTSSSYFPFADPPALSVFEALERDVYSTQG